MNLNRFIKAVAATAGVAFASSIGIGSISSALANPINIDLDGYCKDEYQVIALGVKAWAEPNGITAYNSYNYSWSCAQRLPNGRVNKYRIDMSSVCMKKKGTGIYGFSDQRNPLAWYCGEDNRPRGGI